ncbi:hypothetical protein [Vibrio crassostreae]|uniref:hypothetical protein n=1 Tax=Vibrio crassostreae TaxID=246167 RepID=UPI001B302C3F|nr:hypothetical protein [Vibrio crassostreae]
MHLNLHDFIASNEKYFDSYDKNVHGASKSNLRMKTLKLLKERKDETMEFVQGYGVTTEELYSAFSDDSKLSASQKSKLAKTLYLVANDDNLEETQKRLLSSFLVTNPTCSKELGELDTTKISTQSTSIKDNVFSMKEVESALSTIEAIDKKTAANKLYIGLEKAFCSSDVDEALNPVDIREKTLELISDLKINEGSELDDLKSTLRDFIEVDGEVDPNHFESTLKELTDASDKSVKELESSLVEANNAESYSQVRGKIAMLGETIKADNPSLSKRIDLATGGSNQVLDDFALFTNTETISGGTSFGLLQSSVDRSKTVVMDAVDYSSEFDAILEKEEFTFTKRVSRLEKIRSSDVREAEVIQSMIPKGSPDLEKNDLENDLEADPKIKKAKALFDDIVASKVSDVKDSKGDSLLVIDTRKKLVDFTPLASDKPYRASFSKSGFMNKSVHKMAALKARESGVKKPVIHLPTAKGVTDEQKIQFFKSMYSELLDAGYAPDKIDCSSIKADGARFESNLSKTLKEAQKEVLESKGLAQLSSDMEMGGLADISDKENLEKIVDSRVEGNLDPNQLAQGTFEQKMEDGIDKSIQQQASAPEGEVNPFAASQQATQEAQQAVESDNKRLNVKEMAAKHREKRSGNGLRR